MGAEQSAEMAAALRVLESAELERGTREERLAEFARAREEIWALADRAGSDSTAIRALTRGLESSEEFLADGAPWDEPPTAGN
ncbi:hypothetical protein [Kribbella sp.]|uniref:hypothetical protein n=1 Tax=Kribbella sp. TaxID=1871183 RepID=UPI002D6631F4|nr:hypothetical protein [Kribbella sp.]HZX07370.1 hypothetical protein [Kribbella sp.]